MLLPQHTIVTLTSEGKELQILVFNDGLTTIRLQLMLVFVVLSHLAVFKSAECAVIRKSRLKNKAISVMVYINCI